MKKEEGDITFVEGGRGVERITSCVLHCDVGGASTCDLRSPSACRPQQVSPSCRCCVAITTLVIHRTGGLEIDEKSAALGLDSQTVV